MKLEAWKSNLPRRTELPIKRTLCVLLLLMTGSQAKAQQHSDHLYWRGDTKGNWFEAQNACRAKGGNLASIHSQADNDFLTSVCFEKCRQQGNCNYQSDCWIGLNDQQKEGAYVWTDGSPTDYISPVFAWNREERDCFHLEGHYSNGTWEGDFCKRELKFYVCSSRNFF